MTTNVSYNESQNYLYIAFYVCFEIEAKVTKDRHRQIHTNRQSGSYKNHAVRKSKKHGVTSHKKNVQIRTFIRSQKDAMLR